MRWEVVHADAGEVADGRASEAEGICGPGVRWGHSCNTVQGGRYLYVFGGYGHNKRQTNDVHVFDTVSNTWIAPNLFGEGPNAREGHGAALVDKRIFIFGGCGKSETQEEKYYNDLYILDTEKLTWERAVTSGSPPSARDCHSCSAWKNQIIVLGGEDSSGFYLSDAYILNADTLGWEPLKTFGKIFPPRAGHTTVALGSNLFVFGGFLDAKSLYDDIYVLNVESRIWSKVIPENQGPCARFAVAGDCLDQWKGDLVFLGGCSESLYALDDMYYLHTDIPIVNGICDRRPEKLCIRRDLKKMYQQEDLLYPGNIKDNIFLKHSYRLHEINQADSKLSYHKSSGKVTFEARVINLNKFGYVIETIIDGKLLHGMLFSSTSNISKDNHVHCRMADDNSNKENTDLPTYVTSTPVERGKISDQEQLDSPGAKKPRNSNPFIDILGSNLTNLTPSVKASWNVEPVSRVLLDVEYDDSSNVPKVPIDQNLSGNFSASAPESSFLNQGIEQWNSSGRQMR
ncbi:acyl-CoA-binding domain-containing protein 6-like isoform X2 [Zingiber officinale]|uniref:acyl-CoA-binding domain-containing protein 6-like isoform X2 n=1 Tax=Zingiber officinale TaxID=94328 RepID=UPI001C4CD72A|nr:acyl-CoA-binding domain-containing protein 6-like isoform X2 [Zingiber officinale]